MPNAVTAIFGGDSRPMEAEYARMETVAKRFGKTIADINAEENAQMLRKSQALKQLIAERNAQIKTSSFTTGLTGNAFLDATTGAGKFSQALQGATRHAGGFNLIIRESLVVMREIGRGNWARVPGSLSLIAQGFSQLKGIPLMLMGAWALAIGGIVGSIFIFYHRVKSLTAALQTAFESAFNPDHIAKYLQKANILAQLEKDIADSARSTKEHHDSVAESLQRELDLTKDRIAFETQLLEIQKQNELAMARTPQQREEIEKRYSKKILDMKKEERDAEVKKMQEEVRQLPGEIDKTKAEIKRLTGGDFIGEPRDAQILEERKKASAAYDDYRKQLKPGEKDERKLSADADRARLARFEQNKREFERLWNSGSKTDQTRALFFQPTAEETAKADAARQRLNNSASTEKAVNDWMDTKDDRDRARMRVKELEDRVKADQKRLAELGPRGGGAIEDAMKRNLQKDKEDLALEKERLSRTDNPGAHDRGYGLNAQQRLGAYAATPFDFRRMETATVQTAQNTARIPSPGLPTVNKQPVRFGAHA